MLRVEVYEVFSMEKGKHWYMSKTLWVNVLATLAAVFAGVADYISTGGAITILALINVVLRIITTQPLTK